MWGVLQHTRDPLHLHLGAAHFHRQHLQRQLCWRETQVRLGAEPHTHTHNSHTTSHNSLIRNHNVLDQRNKIQQKRNLQAPQPLDD